MWAVTLRCYMMYVMLSPFLLHEIGSRSMLLIDGSKWTGRRTCYAVRRWLSYSLAYISKHCKVSEIEIFFVLSRRSNKWKTKCVISMTVYVLFEESSFSTWESLCIFHYRRSREILSRSSLHAEDAVKADGYYCA